jgi:hypothetical protein
MRKLNWPLWVGFLVSIAAFVTYPTVFVNWPITRDFPWANLLLFAVALVFLMIGVKRAFAPGRRLFGQIVAGVVTFAGLAVLGFFILVTFIGGRQLPSSTNAPQVAQQAPDFNLLDTNNKPVSLSELRTQPIDGKAPKGTLLIFYRGYW